MDSGDTRVSTTGSHPELLAIGHLVSLVKRRSVALKIPGKPQVPSQLPKFANPTSPLTPRKKPPLPSHHHAVKRTLLKELHWARAIIQREDHFTGVAQEDQLLKGQSYPFSLTKLFRNPENPSQTAGDKCQTKMRQSFCFSILGICVQRKTYPF